MCQPVWPLQMTKNLKSLWVTLIIWTHAKLKCLAIIMLIPWVVDVFMDPSYIVVGPLGRMSAYPQPPTQKHTGLFRVRHYH